MPTKKQTRKALVDEAVRIIKLAERTGTPADCREAIETLYFYSTWGSPVCELLREGGEKEFNACIELVRARLHNAATARLFSESD